MNDTTRITVRLPPELHAEATLRAQDKGMSINEWIVRALTYALTAKGATLTYVTKVEI